MTEQRTISDIIDKAGVRRVARAAGVQPATAHYWKLGLPTPTGPKAERRRGIERAIAKASGIPVAEIRKIAAEDDRRRIRENPPETLADLLKTIGLGRVAEVCMVSYRAAQRWTVAGLPPEPNQIAQHRRTTIERNLAKTSGLTFKQVHELALEHDKARKAARLEEASC